MTSTNISDQWLDYADAIIGFKTSPHVDEFERGLEAGRVISSIIKGKIKPTMALAKPPILIGGGLMTIVDDPLGMIKPPMHRLVHLAKKMELEDRVVNVTVAGGFGHADVPRAGIGMLVTTNNASELAKQKVEELSNLAWELRSQFLPSQVLTSLKDSMEQAISATQSPVILADQGDNAAGGGPADGTFILSALKELDWPDATLVIKDDIVAHQAAQSGIGSEVSVSAGAKTDKLHGVPVQFSGTVSHLSNGIYKSTRERLTVRMGETAVVECGHTEVVFTQSLAMQTDPQLFTSQGIDPRRKRIVVLKSAHAFRDLFGKFASQIIEVDTPGVTSPNLFNFQFHNVRRPIFPLDDL